MDIKQLKEAAGISTLITEASIKTTANFQSLMDDIAKQIVKTQGGPITVRITKPVKGNVFEYEFLRGD